VSAKQEAALLGDQLVAPDNSEQREQQRELAALLKHLSPRERQVIQTRYQLGPTGAYNVEDIPLPYTEVSQQLGMTTGLAKAVEARALIKLRFWATRSPYAPRV
jgi:RNA polymerase sigma factor (sigma-70 family)